MSDDSPIPFVEYLEAKRSIDERALSRPVWERLAAELAGRAQPLAVLELGAGIGSMVERLASARLVDGASYTAIDRNPDCITEAERRLRHLATDLRLELETVDLFGFAEREAGRRCFDLVVAQALLDLLDLPTVLPLIARLLNPGGLLYFPLSFDGATLFEPEIDRELDGRIETAYHRTMDERLHLGRPSGSSRTGRRLFAELRKLGAEVLAAGASDWVVFAGPDGFSSAERRFLGFILDTVEAALSGEPEIETTELERWLSARRRQLQDGSLVYIAHQLDLLARLPDALDAAPAADPRVRR